MTADYQASKMISLRFDNQVKMHVLRGAGN